EPGAGDPFVSAWAKQWYLTQSWRVAAGGAALGSAFAEQGRSGLPHLLGGHVAGNCELGGVTVQQGQEEDPGRGRGGWGGDPALGRETLQEPGEMSAQLAERGPSEFG